jgi:uncharacterized protein YajQ (UPF0234 family)
MPDIISIKEANYIEDYKIVDTIEKNEAKTIQVEIKSLKLKVTAVNQGVK